MKADVLNEQYLKVLNDELAKSFARMGIPNTPAERSKVGMLYKEDEPLHREFWYVDEEKEINRLLIVIDHCWDLSSGYSVMRIEPKNFVINPHLKPK